MKELLKESDESLSTFPLSAENIMSAFRHSINSFKFSAELRIITYQLFEKFILKHIPDFLKEINDRLIKQGLLPDFESDYSIKKKHNSRQKSHKKTALETHNSLDNNHTLNNHSHNIVVSRLLNLTQSSSLSNEGFHNTPLIQRSAPFESQSGKSTFTQERLEAKILESNSKFKQLLTQINNDLLPTLELTYKNKQKDITNSINNTNQYNADTIELIDAINIIQHKLNINDGHNSSALSIQQQIRKQLILNNEQCSENTQLINEKLYLIDMIEDIFKHLSDNKDLSSTALYLLRSLTLPVIQLTLIDLTFISHKNHPVRIFLDDYSNATMGLTENQSKTNNPLFKTLKDIAYQLKGAKQINTAAFNTLHNKLKQFLSNQNRHIITDHFLSKIAIEKEIDAIIKGCIDDKQLPDGIVLIINNIWKNVMLDIFSNPHCDEDDKDKAIAFIDSLIFSIKPVKTDIEIKRVNKIIPVILQELEDGMIRINYPHAVKLKIFQYLNNAFFLALNSNIKAAENCSTAKETVFSTHLDESIANEIIVINQYLNTDPDEKIEHSLKNAFIDHSETIANNPNTESQPLTHPDLKKDKLPYIIHPIGKQKTNHSEKHSKTDFELIRLINSNHKLLFIDDQYTRQAKNLTQDSLLEFYFDSYYSRVRITWIKDDKSQFMLLTQNNRTIDIPLEVLSDSLRQGISSEIQSTSVFDDAIKALHDEVDINKTDK